MKLNTTNVLILAGVVLATLKFRNELLSLVAKIPLVGPLVA